MLTKKKIVLISIIIVSTILLAIISLSRVFYSETKSFETYANALADYNNGDFQNSYYQFSKVSRYSTLKPAAIYRQGKCAVHLNDYNSAVKSFKKLIRFYPKSSLTIRSRYLMAQNLYQTHPQKSKPYFEKIIKRYPTTDYAIASQYYIAIIDSKKLSEIKSEKRKAKLKQEIANAYRTYLKEAPAGRFASNAISQWDKLGIPLSNDDNLLIAKSYIELGQYDLAKKRLEKTSIESSWTVFVKNSFYLKDYPKVKYYTELGLKNYQKAVDKKNIYESIDTYLKTTSSQSEAVKYLTSLAKNDYTEYLNCNNMPRLAQKACYNTYYYKYPNGQFSADVLANIFYLTIREGDFITAKRIGREHLSKFKDSNSAPRVMFWMGKVSERSKNYDDAGSYYKGLITKYPDDYYAMRAFLRKKRLTNPLIVSELNPKTVVFPYEKSLDSDLVIKLADLQDYGLISEICNKDDFVQSWLAYKKGEYSHSAVLARDAMEKLNPKPAKEDLRWRLVYPIHYYENIRDNALPLDINPIMILSIIREESYFNPNAKSYVNATGLMQLMPATANEVMANHGLSGDMTNPIFNIRVGNYYYSQLLKNLDNKDIFAVAAYNGGIGAVKSWQNYLNVDDYDDFVEQIPYPETQNYLKKVFRTYWNYSRIYQ